MNTVLTTDQVSAITNILMQYAPDGWTSLRMHLVTDETHTELTTWAVTESWEASSRAWNTLDFSVTADGDFELNAQ